MKKKFTYDYARPQVTADVLVFWHAQAKTLLDAYILLIKRKNEPFKDCWAFPGGFVDINEKIEYAARRELKEELGLPSEELEFKPEGVFDDIQRDPRDRTITHAFSTWINDKQLTQVHASDDAKEAKCFRLTDALGMPLAFDHKHILQIAIRQNYNTAYRDITDYASNVIKADV